MKNEKLKMKKGIHASLSADRGTDVTCLPGTLSQSGGPAPGGDARFTRAFFIV
jgi:hypothetical protein